MLDKSFNRFIRFCVECKDVEIFLSEEFLYGLVLLFVIWVPVAVFRKNSPLMIFFYSLWRLIKLFSYVNMTGGGLLLPALSFVPGVFMESHLRIFHR
jgi:hypothetical protein